MRYAVIDAEKNTWLYETDSLDDALEYRGAATEAGCSTVLVEVLAGEEGETIRPSFNRKLRAALESIIGAANANPHPIHFKVKEAIDKARSVI